MFFFNSPPPWRKLVSKQVLVPISSATVKERAFLLPRPLVLAVPSAVIEKRLDYAKVMPVIRASNTSLPATTPWASEMIRRGRFSTPDTSRYNRTGGTTVSRNLH